ASRDQRVKNALEDLAGDPLDFPRLRRVYETMWTEFSASKKDAERKIDVLKWATLPDLELFAEPVNTSPEQAAHSVFSRYDVSANPLTLATAGTFLEGLLDRWIASKI